MIGLQRVMPSSSLDLPDDDAQLRPWLKQKYTHLVAGLVHLNAMQHAQNMQAQQAQPQQMQQVAA